MRFCGLLFTAVFLASSLVIRADDMAKKDEASWSQPVQGLRARLFTRPSTEPEYDKTYDVWIEIQEVGTETSLGVVDKAVTIRYVGDNSQFQFEINDGKGADVSEAAPGPVDEAVGAHDLILPPKGDLTFPIGYGGSSPHHPPPGEPTPKGRLLIFDATRQWLIPFADGPYHLAASLVVSAAGGQLPNAAPYHGWVGTLELPPIELPAR
jgi:hypothetical protein